MATDVASKGLDFPMIQHVINYDMPDDIENYVHRLVLSQQFPRISYRLCSNKDMCRDTTANGNPLNELKKTSAFFRIGRTGRGNAKGWATTLINKSVEEAVLLDLKHLLIEAKQKVDECIACHELHLTISPFLCLVKGAAVPGHADVGAGEVPGAGRRRQGLLVLRRPRPQNRQLPQAGRHPAQEGGRCREEGLSRGKFGRLLTCILYPWYFVKKYFFCARACVWLY